MRTALDESKFWFLESLVFRGDVSVVVVEGVKASESEDIVVGEVTIQGTHALSPTSESRRALVRFTRPVAWQVVDESYTSRDESEVRDDNGFLTTLTSSAYLRFVETHHGWFKDMVGPACHYRLWTEDAVLDVIAHDEPRVELQ